jgi:macrodomain Ter protein organizer (MatP/YcbG family)
MSEKDISEIKQAIAKLSVSISHLENDMKDLSDFCKNHLASELNNVKVDIVRLYERVNIIKTEQKTTKQRVWDIALLVIGAIITSSVGGLIGALITRLTH